MVKVSSIVQHFVRHSELVNLHLNSPVCKATPRQHYSHDKYDFVAIITGHIFQELME